MAEEISEAEISIATNFTILKELIESRNVAGLKELGVRSSKEALTYNDARLVEIAVIAYAISKLIEKPYIYNTPKWKTFNKRITGHLERGFHCATDGKDCDKHLTELIDDIESYSEETGRFVMNVIEKARIKAAMQIYAHGASINQAIELTNADKWELLTYMGGTRIADNYPSRSIKERMKNAQEIFKNGVDE